MKHLPKLLLAVFVLTAAGCDNTKEAPTKHHKWGKYSHIDTISIHDNAHEVVIYANQGMMHSPECWCGKEVSK